MKKVYKFTNVLKWIILSITITAIVIFRLKAEDTNLLIQAFILSLGTLFNIAIFYIDHVLSKNA